METNWVKIYSTSNAVEARLITNKLESENISVTQLNKQDSMHIHLNTFSPIELYVPKDHAFRAVQLISQSDKYE